MQPTSTNFTLELISRMAELERLRPEWLNLWTRIDDATPFQAPHWLLPWWRHLGVGELCVIVLRRDGELVGLVPSGIHCEGLLSTRKFALLGSGVSDYLDALFDPGVKSACAEQALLTLTQLTPRWDVCEFAQLRPDSPLFEAPAPLTWNGGIMRHDPCPVLSFRQHARALTDVIPAHQAANVRYYQARAARYGRLTYEHTTAENLEAALGELFRLHDARWRSTGGAGVLQGAAIRRFHRAVAEAMLEAGLLRLNVLRLDGRAVAVYYGFTHRERAYYYLGGFDPKFSALSPGTLAVAHAIEQALAEGVKTFDFLRGHERYKYLWGAEDTFTYRRTLSYHDSGLEPPISL